MDTKITKTTKTTKDPIGLDLGGLRTFVIFVLAVGAVPLLTACASASAKAPAERPALNVPPPPPHVIESAPEPTEPVGELPQPSSPPSSASRAPRREVPPKPAEAKADAPPEPAPPVSAAPNPQLRTPQTADTSGAAKSVRVVLERAKNTLATVNYGPLSNERKKAYNDAKQFIQQAEDALKEGNFVFAQGVASKAETLARELAGR